MENSDNKDQEFKEVHEFMELKRLARKKETHSEDLLAICAVLIAVLTILGGLVMFIGLDFSFWITIGYVFMGFIAALFLYVIAKICRILVEIKDVQIISLESRR